MLITTEHTWLSFTFWGGAIYTVETLSSEEMDTVWHILENDLYPDGAEATTINDFFWFDLDTIAEWLGYDSWEELEAEKEQEE